MEVLTADKIAELLKISKSRAYKIIQQLNKELKEMGKLTIRGRVNKKYFEERIGV